MTYWMEDAERVTTGNPHILGEDERGDIRVPAQRNMGWYSEWTLFRWWNPAHWPYYLRSRLTRRVAWLETP